MESSPFCGATLGPLECLDAALDLLRENGIAFDLRDEHFGSEPIEVTFVGTLRLDQDAAVSAMLPGNPMQYLGGRPTLMRRSTHSWCCAHPPQISAIRHASAAQ